MVVYCGHARHTGSSVPKPQQLLKLASTFQRPANARLLEVFVTKGEGKQMGQPITYAIVIDR